MKRKILIVFLILILATTMTIPVSCAISIPAETPTETPPPPAPVKPPTETTAPAETPEPTPPPIPSPQPEEKEEVVPEIEVELQTIAVLVDKSTYCQIRTEIERYVEDIENDLQAIVFLYHQNWQNPQEVRNQLLSLKDENLRGAVLIGEIPVPYFEGSWCGIGANVFLSDRYYMDLEDAFFTDEDNDGKFETANYFVKENVARIIWIGRIKPYVTGIEGINLLKNYFERNHQYRMGEISPTERLLVYSPNIHSGPGGTTLEIYLDNMRDSLTSDSDDLSNTLYSRAEINILVGSSGREYLEELQKDYEISSTFCHGTQTTQILGDGTISSEDIETAQPKPYFYFLYSCSNGDFTQEDYIGGHYLFDGNGLVVYTTAAPSMAGADEMQKYVEPLALGLTFGEAAVLESNGSPGAPSLGIPEIILGDPTLHIRPKIGVPRVEVSTTEIDFGEVVAVKDEGLSLSAFEEALEERTITIKNVGTGKLILRMGWFYMENEGAVRGDESVGYYDEPIPPGESSTIEFEFWPKEKGYYIGLAVINTNDPDNPVIVIKLRGRGI
ncbi:hypothetical protein ES707_09754 [subsurface metagenome]